MMLEYDAIGLRISSLSKMIYHIQEEEKKIAKLLSSYLKTIPEALILLTLPGVGTILCSRFLSGIGNIDRFSNSDALALYCGVACLDDTSGKRQGSKRASRAHYPINHVAKDAIMQIARCSIRVNPQSKT
jgi:transposase